MGRNDGGSTLGEKVIGALILIGILAATGLLQPLITGALVVVMLPLVFFILTFIWFNSPH